MAVDAKDVKKDVKSTSTGISWEEVMLLILGIIALLFVFIPKIFTLENGNSNQNFNVKSLYDNHVINTNQGPSISQEVRFRFADMVSNFSTFLFIVIIFLVLLFSVIIYYNNFRKELIKKSYNKKFIPEDKNIEIKNEQVLIKSEPDNNGIINSRWQVVGKYYNSANQSDWKLAILEADIMLYEVLNKNGFQGDSIGEMLKNTDKSKLHTLNEAWSAHKIRNEIAHQGLDYTLTREKVEGAISNYEKVFDELNFI